MSKGGQIPIGFSAAPPPSAPPSYTQAMGGVAPQAPFYPAQQPGILQQQDHILQQQQQQQQQPFLPQQAGMAQPMQVGPSTIVTTIVPLGPQSTHMICPHCHHEVNTTTTTSPSKMAYIASLIICCIGCPLGCCLIPCCIPNCMNVKHTCPNCTAHLGKYVT